MNMQERMIDRRTFRIAAIAVAAVAVLVIAAYLFGTGLRADAPASVAPSSEESSVAAVRKVGAVAPSNLAANYTDTRGARTIVSAERAAALAAVDKRRADWYADLHNLGVATRLAALSKLTTTQPFFLAGSSSSAAAAPSSAVMSAAEYAAKSGVPAASVAIPETTIRASHYARLGTLTAEEARSLGNIAPAAATLATSHYGRLGSLTAAEAAILGNIAPAAAANSYQNEWMGFTSPESVQTKAVAATNPTSLAAASQFADRYDRMNSPSAAGLSLPAGFHDSSADFYGKPSTSSAADLYRNAWMGVTSPESVRASSSPADLYRNAWMGITSPESVGARPSVVPSTLADPSTSIKPEGIRPATSSGADQLQWVKPEGIKAFGAR